MSKPPQTGPSETARLEMRLTSRAAPLALMKRSLNVNFGGAVTAKSPSFLNIKVPRKMAGITKVRANNILSAKSLIVAMNIKYTAKPINVAEKAFQ